MFRIKCISIVLVITLLAGGICGYVLIGKKTYIKQYSEARAEYKTAANKDYQKEEQQYQDLVSRAQKQDEDNTNKIKEIEQAEIKYNEAVAANEKDRVDYLNKEKQLFITNNDNSRADLKKHVDDYVTKGFARPKSEFVYSYVLSAVANVDNAELVMFVPDTDVEYAYTVKYVGFARGLSEVLENFSNICAEKKARLSIGNFSLRQVYNAYSNDRPWDETTMLDWYDDSYITGANAVAKILGGYKFRDVQITGKTAKDTESIEELEQARNAALQQNAIIYNAKRDNIQSLELSKLAEAASSGNYGNHPNFDEFQNELKHTYKSIIDQLYEEEKQEKDRINAEYDARIGSIDSRQQEETYYDPSNPDLLIYVLDITFSVDPGELPFIAEDLLGENVKE